MITVDSVVRRRELGYFVRAQREQLAPAAIDLAGARRRRTPACAARRSPSSPG